MFHWSYKNHFTSGFHSNSTNEINKNIHYSKVASPSREIFPAFKEAQIAARLIYQYAQKLKQELFLCLSGGVDSEAMLKAFLFAEVPFKAIIMRFNDNLNDFDIKEVLDFCESQSIPYEIFDLNVFDFFGSGKYLEYGKKYQCQSPQLATHLYLCDSIKGCPVLSWQAPEVYYHINDKGKLETSKGLPNCLHSVYLRYFVANKRWGIPFFFLYTPELLSAFFHLPFLQRIIWFGQMGAHACGSYELKCIKYMYSGFPVTPKEQAYTGFEKIKDYYDLKDQKAYGLGFNHRYRLPLKKLNPIPKVEYQIIPEETFICPHEFKSLNKSYKKQILQMGSKPDPLFLGEMKKFDTEFFQLLQAPQTKSYKNKQILTKISNLSPDPSFPANTSSPVDPSSP